MSRTESITGAGLMAGVFIVAILLLFGFVGGYILGAVVGLLMILAMPVILLVGLAQGMTERRQISEVETVAIESTEAEETEALTEPIHAGETVIPVEVSVVESRGTCPLGYTFHAGERFLLTNGGAASQLCPRASKALQPLVGKVRAGEYPARTFPFCETEQHIVVFDLKKMEKIRAKSPKRKLAGTSV